MKRIMVIVFLCLFLIGCGGGIETVEAQQNTSIPFDQLAFASDRTNGVAGIRLTGYSGIGGPIVIQREINRIPIRFIGDSTFSGKKVFSVTIPDSVVIIGNSAFSNNIITSVTIPNSVTQIGGSAFAKNLLTSVTIPNSVTQIGDSVFANNLLTSITIPNSVTQIGGFAFANNLLTSITIPNSVTQIGGSAFANNLLTSITIGSNVQLPSDSVFGGGFFNLYNGVAGTYTRPDINTAWTRR